MLQNYNALIQTCIRGHIPIVFHKKLKHPLKFKLIALPIFELPKRGARMAQKAAETLKKEPANYCRLLVGQLIVL